MKFNGKYTPQEVTREVISSHVTIEEVKTNLKFDDPAAAHAADSRIAELIEAAREAAENYTGRIFAETECTFYAYNYSGNTLRINAAPFINIKSIRVKLPNASAFTTLTAETDFNIFRGPKYFEIYFEQADTFDEIEVKFYAGYTDETMPYRVKQFIIVEASDGYDTDSSKYTYQVTDSNLQARILAPYIITRY